MSTAIHRNDVGMCLHFASAPIPACLEFADSFIVDFSPDDDVIGLEFLYPDDWHIGCEPEMLAFGVFGAALLWLGYNYARHGGDQMRQAVLQKAKQFIAAADLELQAAASGKTGLTITDCAGNALLCADLQYQPQRLLKTASASKSAPGLSVPKAQMAEIGSAINDLAKTALPPHPGAVGIAAVIDEIGDLHYQKAVAPGRWVDWPEALLPNGKQLWAHIAIIPPSDRRYSWLPDGFLPCKGAASATDPSPVLC